MAAITGACILWHVLLPAAWGWMSSSQLGFAVLATMIFAGTALCSAASKDRARVTKHNVQSNSR